MKTQTYMTVRMSSFLLAAAIPMIGVVAATQQHIAVNATRSTQPTLQPPCEALAYVVSNRNNKSRVDVLDVAPSYKTDCR